MGRQRTHAVGTGPARIGSRTVAVAGILGLALAALPSGPAPRAAAATPVTVAIGDAALLEGDTGARTMHLPVVLSDPVGSAVVVSYALAGSSATPGVDFTMTTPNTLTIPAGQVVARIPISVTGDGDVEPNETVTVALTGVSGGPVAARSAGVATILNDDPGTGLRWGVGNVTIPEGDTGTPRVARVPVSISAAQGQAVSVRYEVVAGSATPGVDYRAAATGVVRIAAGARTGSVPIEILPDVSPEPVETVTVRLSAPSAGTVRRATGILRILDDDRGLHAWGNNGYGRLGDGTTVPRYIPVRIGLDADWSQVAAGDFHSCAIRSPGRLFCWGANDAGQLGDGTTTARFTPTRVGTATTWAQVSTGVSHTCGLRNPGTLWCWGANDTGQLGDGTTTGRSTPVQVGAATDWAAVSAGRGHTCALRRTGALFCWGANEFGQVGDGTSSTRLTPTRIGFFTDWTAVSAGRNHTCGIRAPGTLWCWGTNGSGQLGDGTTRAKSNPVPAGLFTDWSAVAAGRNHTCGIRRPGTLWCWGANGSGQLGLGSTVNRRTPTQVGTALNWARVAGGGVHTCGTRTSRTLWCWGGNGMGQVGDGTTTRRLTPTRIGTATTWVDVAAGRTHSLGIKRP